MNTKKFPDKPCLECGSLVKHPKVYCNNSCQFQHQNRIKVERLFSQNLATDKNRPLIKKYLILKRGHKCEKCNNTEWMGQLIPLVLDHIDGNSYNNIESNFRLLCGNCDMQTDTYKNKNKGKGREYRRINRSGV